MELRPTAAEPAAGQEWDTLPQPVRDLIAAQKPGWGLERAFYTDPAIFALELERVFFPRWVFAGHASRIPNRGQYFTYQIGSEPLIVIRGHDGQVRALWNVCRHRGSTLCLAESGTARKLVCPYHQWIYETDGRLAQARWMPDEFDREAFGLHQARVRLVEGFIFLCLADTPRPFPDAKRTWLAPYGFEQARVAHRASYEVKANWKIVVENFTECYHCGGVHPEYSRVMAGATSTYVSEEAMTAESGRTREERRAIVTHLGLDPDAPRLPFRRGACTQSLDGRPVAPLMGTHRDYDGTMLSHWIGDTLEMEASPDHVVTFRFTPLDVMRTDVEVNWLVRGDAVEGVDYERERLIEFWTLTGEQDWGICEAVQAGVSSLRYQPGPLSRGEKDPQRFLRRYLAQLAGEE